MSDRNCENCASLITSECGEPDCEWGHIVCTIDEVTFNPIADAFNKQCEDRSES